MRNSQLLSVYLEESLFGLKSWRTTLLNKVLLVGTFFLSEVWIYHPILFWPSRSLLGKSSDSLFGVPFYEIFFPLWLLFKFFVFQQFYYCVLEKIISDKKFEVTGSWSWLFSSLCGFGNFLAIIFLKETFYSLSSSFSFWDCNSPCISFDGIS